jgi:hypothetical protein
MNVGQRILPVELYCTQPPLAEATKLLCPHHEGTGAYNEGKPTVAVRAGGPGHAEGSLNIVREASSLLGKVTVFAWHESHDHTIQPISVAELDYTMRSIKDTTAQLNIVSDNKEGFGIDQTLKVFRPTRHLFGYSRPTRLGPARQRTTHTHTAGPTTARPGPQWTRQTGPTGPLGLTALWGLDRPDHAKITSPLSLRQEDADQGLSGAGRNGWLDRNGKSSRHPGRSPRPAQLLMDRASMLSTLITARAHLAWPMRAPLRQLARTACAPS